jgi:hypothetical protein
MTCHSTVGARLAGDNGRRAPARRLPARTDRQAGMTTIGFLILAVFLGLFAFAFIRLTPVYLNYLKVAGVLEGVHKEYDGQGASLASLRDSISRRFSVESVSQLTARDIKVTPNGSGYLVEAVYDQSAPFIGNISFSVHFDKKVQVRR